MQNKRPDASLSLALLPGVVLAGVVLRLIVTISAGNGMRTPWGGGGDTGAYLTLARNLLEGRGYAYAGQPTALRPPLYPILLAGFIELFGGHALAGVRWLQFFEGLGVAFLCSAVAGKVYGDEAKKAALAIVLFFPPLVLLSGEILTETTASLISAFFLYLLVLHIDQPQWITLAGLSAAVGIAALVRFNMALLGFVVLWVVLFQQKGLPRWRGATIAIFLPILVISPWLIRNLVVFHGSALFSTHGGMNALLGIVTPQGRALPDDSAKLRAILGWVPPVELETNAPSRDRLPDEPTLDRECRKAAFQVWRETGWGLVPITLAKLSTFWLSTDQLFWTQSFPPLQRATRGGGVLVYWALLLLAVAGWFRMRTRKPQLARLVLFYFLLVTVLHVPFVMNTRLRVPFTDPWLAVLAGLGVLCVMARGPAEVSGPASGGLVQRRGF
jgi:4-amino-4-deoxy-L-arabinose transferase-like glycosyltransferase